MLASFSLQNWMSFKDKITISTIASRQKKHKQRVPYIKNYRLRVLPVAAIYGGNASGKSNLFKSFQFAREFIVKSLKIDEKIDILPFILSSDTKKPQSSFEFMIIVDEKMYEFSFSVTNEYVCKEKLVEIRKTTEKTLYERNNQNFEIYNEDEHLRYIKTSTRNNQLFLTNTIENNNNCYKDVYIWFRDQLKLISPESHFNQLRDFCNKDSPFNIEANNLLKNLDTGISRLGDEDIDIKEIGDIKYIPLLETISKERYIKLNEKEGEKVKKLVTYHENESGEEIKFDFKQESDGTRRLIEILPAFIGPEVIEKNDLNFNMVFIIDELDRSLHHLLVRNLLKRYLSICNQDSRQQLIFTTHDLLLMDQDLLRRDEIFIVERNNKGASSVISLNEYKGIRSDKDIRKNYLLGRFGGIPKI
jgi:uncharacterized protein